MSSSNHSPLNLPVKPLLLILSGLSGAGKDAVLTSMKESGYPLEYIMTVTTRPQRAYERDNVDYHFISTQEFQLMIERDELLEWARVYGNWYGVPKPPVKQALARGKDIMIKVDVQGVANIKKVLPQAVFIFLAPSSIEELILRLKHRGSESPSSLALRTRTAQEELKRLPLFDYIVFNRPDEIERAAADIGAIVAAEKCRVAPREISL